MADKKIEEATLAESITGTDVVPAAVGENPAPRKVSIAQIGAFVIDALAALTGEEALPETFTLFISKANATGNDTVTKITPVLLSGRIASILFANDSATLAGTEKIIVKSGNDNRTTTLAAVLAYVKANIGDVMDIDGLDAIESSEIATSTYIPTHPSGGEHNKKITFGSFFNWIHSVFSAQTNALSGSETFDDTDSILIEKGGVVRKVQLQNSGLNPANSVKAPQTTHDGKIPLWDGNNVAQLKDGLLVDTSVGSATDDTSVPTTKAVQTKIESISGNYVQGPESATDDRIPLFDGVTGKKVKDGGISIKKSTTGSTASGSDTALATEKAVNEIVDTRIEKPSGVTDGHIAQFDGTTGAIKDGLALQTTVRASGASDDTSVPSEKAVRTAIETAAGGKMPKITGATNGHIAQINATTGCVEDGLALVQAVGSSAPGSNTSVMSERKVNDALLAKVDKPDAAVTDGNVPVFDGTTGKLKNGPDIKYLVNASSTDSDVPTAKAVHSAMQMCVRLPQGSGITSGKVTKWSGIGGVLADGFDVRTTVRPTASASNDSLPSEKAVAQRISDLGAIELQESSPSENKIPVMTGSNRIATASHTIKTSVAGTVSAAEDTNIPTEKAVRSAIEDAKVTNPVVGPNATSVGRVPKWGVTTRNLEDGFDVSTTIPSSAATASDTKIPTEKAVAAKLESTLSVFDGSDDVIPTAGYDGNDQIEYVNKSHSYGVRKAETGSYDDTNLATEGYVDQSCDNIRARALVSTNTYPTGSANAGDMCLCTGGGSKRLFVAISGGQSPTWYYVDLTAFPV